MSDLAKLTAEELLERGHLNAPCQPGSVMAEIRRRLERLEGGEARERILQEQNDAFDKMGAEMSKRLEKCEASMVAFERAAQDGFRIAQEYRKQIAIALMHRKATPSDKERMSMLDEQMKHLKESLVARAAVEEK